MNQPRTKQSDMKIKMLVVDMEADNITATSNMINALAEILKTAFPAPEGDQENEASRQ